MTVWNKLGVFPSPFHVSTSSRLNLAGAFRGGYIAACSTAFRSATEEKDFWWLRRRSVSVQSETA